MRVAMKSITRAMKWAMASAMAWFGIRTRPRSSRAALVTTLALAVVAIASVGRPGAQAAVPSTTVTPAATAQRDVGGARHLIVVSGLGGESYYDELFQRWSKSLVQVARERLNIAAGNVRVLTANPESTAGSTDALQPQAASREAVLAAITDTATSSVPGDLVVLVLIGHGTAQNKRGELRARFNLPGPDLSPQQIDQALLSLAGRTVVVVNAASASGAFLTALSRPQRIVITATSSGAENQHARFAGHFVSALTTDAADADKDSRVSVLEAFRFASRSVVKEFESNRQLRTEHAMLDDNGDGVGTREPDLQRSTGDGLLAARTHLASPIDVENLASAHAQALLRLEVDARRLVDAIEALKRRKPYLVTEVYLQRLESLLLELALNRRSFKRRSAQ